MATTSNGFKGMTPPISTALPTAEELRLNDLLVEELKRQNNFETPVETERRKKVLGIFQKIAVEFVKEVLTRKQKPPSIVNAAGGKIFTFGSYRLGVYGPGSDIDTLLVAPKDVTRDDFFEIMPSILQKHSPPDAIEEMTPVPEAFVPIIKLEYMGVSIDLIFASIQRSSIPLNMDLKSNDELRGLDDRGLRSLNGTRVTDEILELVPQQKVFRTALRAIKLWSKQRAVYANIIGFPGGVVWAMLVARVCQLYPQACASAVVGKFFRLIGTWPWPQPVLLKPIEEKNPLNVKIWNPALYASDKYHLMPIITPAYPSMCATHNVTMSTRAICTKELKRGADICDKIFTGQLAWKDLFVGHTFFTQGYKYYLSIVSSSRTKEAQQLWSGTVESKVRLLIGNLDHNDLIALAHPFNKGFERVHRCQNDDQISAVMRGDLSYQVKEIKTETTDATNDPKHNAAADGVVAEVKTEEENKAVNGSGATDIYTTTYYIGLQLSEQAKKLDISWATNNFKEVCTGWQSYNAELNEVHVIHTRNVDLPDDVFKPGEVKPTRLKKKSGTRANGNGTAMKRKADEQTDDAINSAKRRIPV